MEKSDDFPKVTDRSYGTAGNWTDFPRRTSIIRLILLLSSTAGFSLSLHGHAWWQRSGRWFCPFLTYLVKGTVKIPLSGFFLYCLSQSLAGKTITLKRAQSRKLMPWVTSLNQVHTALTHLTLNPLIINTARFVYLGGPQFCSSLSLTLGFHTATNSHRIKDWNDLFQANQHYPLTRVTKFCAILLQSPASLHYTNYNLAVWYSPCRKKHAK